MKRFLITSFIASILASVPLLATTEIAGSYYSRDEYQLTHAMFDRIRADLDRAQANDGAKFIGDGARFDIARTELGKLEGQWDRAHFDTSEFDNAYTALHMVLNDNRLVGHDRDVLSTDESRLIEFRQEYY